MKKNAYSLIEILVVLAIFSIITVVATQSILFSLKGTRKSDSETKVRTNLEYATAVIERQVRNAKSITNCDGTTRTALDYEDQYDNATSFSCSLSGSDTYIASGSARLSSSEIKIVNCSFTCTPSTTSPPEVDISLAAQAANAQGAEQANITVNTKVLLRTY